MTRYAENPKVSALDASSVIATFQNGKMKSSSRLKSVSMLYALRYTDTIQARTLFVMG